MFVLDTTDTFGCMLENVVRSAVSTKVSVRMVDNLTSILVDAVEIVREGSECDIRMIEVIEMMHRGENETRLVRGLVLDHGTRHPGMPQRAHNAFILVCNISLEFEKTEVNAEFFYSNAEEREKLVKSEREYILGRVRKIVDLKNAVCSGARKDHGFVVITQKGIDPFSLDVLAKNSIMALRRAKKRNMERLMRACGGKAVDSADDLCEDVLGFAGLVYEHVLGEDKFTFVEECRDPKSATILIKGPQKHSIQQIKDAVRDGLKAASNLVHQNCVLPGAGAFEVALSQKIIQHKNELKGSHRLAAQALADAILIVPKVIIGNSGFDVQDTLIKLQQAYTTSGIPMGVDVRTGLPIEPLEAAIVDGFEVKKNCILAAMTITSSLLLVDEIIRAGISVKGGAAPPKHVQA